MNDEFKVPVNIKPLSSINTALTQKSQKDHLNENKEEIIKETTNEIQSSHNVQCPYKEPKWSTVPDENLEYKFEVLKSGAIVEEINNLQLKPYWSFGRLPKVNDIVMAHPTISRFHAVLQYRPKQKQNNDDEDESNNSIDDSKFDQGWYIYDLDSTHGTFLNKMRIPPKTYIPVKVGHMIKLGGSTRHYILQGPEFDEEPESELSVTELKQIREKEIKEKALLDQKQEELREKEGIDWGMGEDADEETDLSVNPYASTNNEELFFDDPKKTLRGFFEREGLDLEYKADEMSAGTFICRVELPIDDIHGKPIIAEVCHKGKKKECVVQCALEACRILDRHGVLRQSHHEPLKRKKPKDDSDEDDDFLDRTGDVERKRQRKSAINQNEPLTYEDLIKQENELLEKIATVEENILRCQEILKRSKETEKDNDNEDLDNYMKHLTEDSTVDKTEIRKLRVEQQRLKSEHLKVQKLIKIAKPVQLPPLPNQSTSQLDNKKKMILPLFGKRNKLKMTIVRSETRSKTVEKEMKSDEEEIEEDEDTDNHTQNNAIKIDAELRTSELLEKNLNEKEIYTQTGNEKQKEVKEKSVNENKSITPKKQIGPAFIPDEIIENIQKHSTITSDEKESESKEDLNEKNTETDVPAIKEKKRRPRNRNKPRDNIDIDDSAELEDKEKYSGWLPPENQTGDGITSLNDKFGY